MNGWINIDRVYVPGVDLVEDSRYLRSIKNGSVDVIYASHILDQFMKWEYQSALKRWHEVLKEHGELYISVPDFEMIARWYRKTGKLEDLQGLLHGGQDHAGWVRYRSWDYNTLEMDLMDAGFPSGGIQRYDWQHTEFAVRDDYSQAYLPHMDTKNGLLMSLNVKAIK